MFELFVVVVGFLAGLTASIAGFGIGSFLIPLISIQTGTKIAIVLASLPHFLGTGIRFALFRAKVNRKILLRFGLLSAAGGLTGAFIHTFFESNVLQLIFAVMLILAGTFGILRAFEQLRFGRVGAGLSGLVSGFFGGLVGEQGGIRSVALLNFGIQKEAFIATATATALLVDLVRMPIYFLSQGAVAAEFISILALSSFAVIAGTFTGAFLLKRIPENFFKQLVSFLVLLLGIFLLYVGILTIV